MVTAAPPRLAFWLERANLAACEIAALHGYDLVLIDLEHGAIGLEALEYIIAHCRAIGLCCYARVAAANRVLIQQALDFGADGVVLPQIADAGHAAEAAGFAKYPPLGTRGVGYSRAMHYGAADDGFFAAENRRTACHIMIETPGALRDIDQILRLETVDGIFIGPSDLSMTRGRGAFRLRPADAEDFRAAAAIARGVAKAWGMPAPSPDVFALARAEGAAYVTISDDLSALSAGLQSAIEAARARSA